MKSDSRYYSTVNPKGSNTVRILRALALLSIASGAFVACMFCLGGGHDQVPLEDFPS